MTAGCSLRPSRRCPARRCAPTSGGGSRRWPAPSVPPIRSSRPGGERPASPARETSRAGTTSAACRSRAKASWSADQAGAPPVRDQPHLPARPLCAGAPDVGHHRRAAPLARHRSSPGTGGSAAGSSCSAAPASGQGTACSSRSRSGSSSASGRASRAPGRSAALAIPGGGQDSRPAAGRHAALGATALCCTPSYALHLAQVARERGRRPRGPSACAPPCTPGEPGAGIPAVRARIEEAWGARAYDHAGMTEIGAYGFECQAQAGLHVNEAEFIAEVIDPPPASRAAEGELVLIEPRPPRLPCSVTAPATACGWRRTRARAAAASCGSTAESSAASTTC